MVVILVIAGILAFLSGKTLLAILLFVAASIINNCRKKHK